MEMVEGTKYLDDKVIVIQLWDLPKFRIQDFITDVIYIVADKALTLIEFAQTFHDNKHNPKLPLTITECAFLLKNSNIEEQQEYMRLISEHVAGFKYTGIAIKKPLVHTNIKTYRNYLLERYGRNHANLIS